ncbi:MAG: RNA polymerase sigma factor [Thermodesulfobacteriota bacterium]
MNCSDDQEIITAVLGGNKDAYSVLVKRYQKPIFNLMYRVTRSYDDALDLAQETFVKAYENLDHFRKGARFFPWLYTIGFNHAKNFKRRDQVSVRLFSRDCEDENVGLGNSCQQEEHMCNQLDTRRLDQALQQLPIDYREAVMLHYHEGLSMEDIAIALQLSNSGAKMRVHRGIKKLREILLGDQDGAK